MHTSGCPLKSLSTSNNFRKRRILKNCKTRVFLISRINFFQRIFLMGPQGQGQPQLEFFKRDVGYNNLAILLYRVMLWLDRTSCQVTFFFWISPKKNWNMCVRSLYCTLCIYNMMHNNCILYFSEVDYGLCSTRVHQFPYNHWKLWQVKLCQTFLVYINKWGVILLYLLKYCFPGDFSWNLSYSRSCKAISIISLSRQHKCTLYLFLLPGCISFDLEIYRYLVSRSDLHRYRYIMLFHLCLIVKCQVRWSRNLSFDICNWYTHSVEIYICIYYTIPSTVKLWMSVILTCVRPVLLM